MRAVGAHKPGRVVESRCRAFAVGADHAHHFALGREDQICIVPQVECGNVPLAERSEVNDVAELPWAAAGPPELDGCSSVAADRQQASRRRRVAVQEIERAVAAELRSPHPAEQDVGTTDAVNLLEIEPQEPVLFGQVHDCLGDDGSWKAGRQQKRDGNDGRSRGCTSSVAPGGGADWRDAAPTSASGYTHRVSADRRTPATPTINHAATYASNQINARQSTSAAGPVNKACASRRGPNGKNALRTSRSHGPCGASACNRTKPRNTLNAKYAAVAKRPQSPHQLDRPKPATTTRTAVRASPGSARKGCASGSHPAVTPTATATHRNSTEATTATKATSRKRARWKRTGSSDFWSQSAAPPATDSRKLPTATSGTRGINSVGTTSIQMSTLFPTDAYRP